MVNNRQFYMLEEMEVIPEQQYGFRKNRSTSDAHIILESKKPSRTNNISYSYHWT
jgi:hypothetical protein